VVEWEDGWRVSVVDKEKPLLKALSRTGRMFLTKRFGVNSLTFELSAWLVMLTLTWNIGWRHGIMVNIVGWINEVNQRRAWLVLGWVTIFRWLNHLGM